MVVLGPSGAGKSTLLRCLNRLSTPTSGGVYHRGDDVTFATGKALRRLRQSVGMIFQQFNLINRMSVFHNVLSGRLSLTGHAPSWVASHARFFSSADRDIAMDAMRTVGIADLADQRADTLSGGQQQRVAIARVLTQRPDVILADEPIASLDPRSARTVLETLREIHEVRSIPIILNLHQVDLASRYASRVVGMNAGRIVFDDTPDALDEAGIRIIYGESSPPASEAASRKEPSTPCGV